MTGHPGASWSCRAHEAQPQPQPRQQGHPHRPRPLRAVALHRGHLSKQSRTGLSICRAAAEMLAAASHRVAKGFLRVGGVGLGSAAVLAALEVSLLRAAASHTRTHGVSMQRTCALRHSCNESCAKDEPRTLHKPRRPTPGSLAGTRRRHRATARSGWSPGAGAGRRRGSAPRRCLSPGPAGAQGELELWQGGDFYGVGHARRRSLAADRTACCWGAVRRVEVGVGAGARRRRPCRCGWRCRPSRWRSSCSQAARGTRPASSRGSSSRPPPRAPPTGSPRARCTWARRSSCCRRGRP